MANKNSKSTTNLLTLLATVAIAGTGIGIMQKNTDPKVAQNAIIDRQDAEYAAQIKKAAGGPVYEIEVPYGFTVGQWCFDEKFPGSLPACVDTFKTLNRNYNVNPGDTMLLSDRDGSKYILGIPLEKLQKIDNPKQYSTN